MPPKSIGEMTADSCVFLTGATGFVGGCLLERICKLEPGPARVYVLVRRKLGVDPRNRLEKMLSSPVSWFILLFYVLLVCLVVAMDVVYTHVTSWLILRLLFVECNKLPFENSRGDRQIRLRFSMGVKNFFKAIIHAISEMLPAPRHIVNLYSHVP